MYHNVGNWPSIDYAPRDIVWGVQPARSVLDRYFESYSIIGSSTRPDRHIFERVRMRLILCLGLLLNHPAAAAAGATTGGLPLHLNPFLSAALTALASANQAPPSPADTVAMSEEDPGTARRCSRSSFTSGEYYRTRAHT